jgi:hypothetical protein
MQFALVEGQRARADKNLVGTCLLCREPVIAKCGRCGSGIGRIEANVPVMLGGNLKPNGISAGRTDSQKIAER